MDAYTCAILVCDGRILLGRRAPHRRAYPNCWDVIGGKVEVGETIEAALARELSEELGIVPLAFAPIGVVEDRSPHARGHAGYHMFAVTRWQGEPAMCNHEHTNLSWFTIDAACALPDLAMAEYRALFLRVAALTRPVGR